MRCSNVTVQTNSGYLVPLLFAEFSTDLPHLPGAEVAP